MMRKCHLNTCPVGVATQDRCCAPLHRPARARDQLLLLRRRRTAGDHGRNGLPHRGRDGRPGRPLDTRKVVSNWKAQGVDLSRLLHKVEPVAGTSLNWTGHQDHGLDAALDNDLIAAAAPALEARRCASNGR
jgi:glutamate synthase (NADPH/NADH) large chain